MYQGYTHVPFIGMCISRLRRPSVSIPFSRHAAADVWPLCQWRRRLGVTQPAGQALVAQEALATTTTFLVPPETCGGRVGGAVSAGIARREGRRQPRWARPAAAGSAGGGKGGLLWRSRPAVACASGNVRVRPAAAGRDGWGWRLSATTGAAGRSGLGRRWQARPAEAGVASRRGRGQRGRRKAAAAGAAVCRGRTGESRWPPADDAASGSGSRLPRLSRAAAAGAARWRPGGGPPRRARPAGCGSAAGRLRQRNAAGRVRASKAGTSRPRGL